MKVLMSGGGTAGHVYPALSVAERLVAERDDVLFVGTPGGVEARLVPAAGIEFRPLAASGFDRSRPLTLVTGAVRIAASAVRAFSWMGAERPDVVMGFGGYVSIPVGLAAVARGVPLVLHEQNSVPGLANRQLSRWAHATGVTYAESAARLRHPERVELTGNPVRASVLGAEGARGRRSLGVPEDATLLLVFGGSRGARHINEAVCAMRPSLAEQPGLYVVHVAGPSEVDSVRASLAAHGWSESDGRWQVLGYLDEMGDAIAAADLVLSRAGATSIAEITALGAASVLVPYPYATDDHQTGNARTLVENGAAVLVADAELDTPVLLTAVLALLEDPARRASMSAASRALGRPDAAQRVAALARRAAECRTADPPDHANGE